jgi:hypothetical protein
MTDDIERGDRVEVCLHGATTPNDAKGAVVDESPVSVLGDPVLIRLDDSYVNCDNPYEAPRSSVTTIGGGRDD